MARTAFITGASRGIGAEAAVALAHRGYDVAITARTAQEGEAHDHVGRVSALPGSLAATARAVRAAGRRVLPLQADILDEPAMLAAAQAALSEFGRIDLLFNNAVYQGDGNLAAVLEVERGQVEAIMQGNLYTPLALVRALLPSMLEQGQGTILNMVSYAAFNDPPAPADRGGWGFAYPASKAALARLAGSLRAEHAESGLRCYNLEPGTVVTEVMKAAGIAETLMQHYKTCTPAAIGAVVGWLADNAPEAAWQPDGVLHGPAIAKQLQLLDTPSLLETIDE